MNAPQQTHPAGPQAGAARCSSCGGLNPAEAEWCGQCLQRFAPTEPPPPPPQAPAATPPAAGPQGVSASATPAPVDEAVPHADPLVDPLLGPPIDAADPTSEHQTDQLDVLEAALAEAVSPADVAVVQKGAFTIAGDAISWQCRICEAENELAAPICTVCGTRFASAIKAPESTGLNRDPNTVALYSVFWPGAGHAYMGNWPQAIARGVLYTWVFIVTVFAILAKTGLLVAVVFGLASLGLWLVNAHDAYREASGQNGLVILKGRRFLYLTLGLLALLFVMLFSGFMSARAG